ncbi:hypothetical protein JDW15_07925 [Aerococcaceae bacterium zg-ZJ1578]|uniref:hypothetical protein n=1 Tax=Aerococcaceae bacterium zg-252 TaxID=2796928 RepID=UPI001A2A1881|nr:hypothetical protein [Aerococcaceae bacterium zg-1578]
MSKDFLTQKFEAKMMELFPEGNVYFSIPKFNQIDLESEDTIQKAAVVAWTGYAVIIRTIRSEKNTDLKFSLI